MSGKRNWKWNPLPGNLSHDRWKTVSTKSEITALDVKNSMLKNPHIIENYLLKHVDTNTIENLIRKKRERSSSGVKRAQLQLQEPDLRNCRTLSTELASGSDNLPIFKRLEELVRIISRSVDADSYTIYVPSKNETELCIYKGGNLYHYGPAIKGYTVAAQVAVERKTIFVKDVSSDPRFPKGIGQGYNDVGDVLCVPLILPTDDFIAIIEIVKNELKHPFDDNEIKLVTGILGWIGAYMNENGLRRILDAQQQLNDYLLDITKGMFDELTSIDTVVENVMTFTKDLVNADRCSLFLVDEEKDELYADIFDEGKKDEQGKSLFTKRSKVRFDKSKGVAGFALEKGSTLNVYDAYKDERFNMEVDKVTGYKTRNILCMPIATKSKSHGVVEMINSMKSDHFSQMDERALKMFAVYCALALHYCRLYNMLSLQQTQYRVAMELLQYHVVCKREDLKPLLQRPLLPLDDVPPDLTSFYFCGYNFENILPQLFNHLIVNMFGKDRFDMSKLCNFILTVRKNYRPVTYHNWFHGFHVAHCAWCMIDQSPGIFSDFEKMALIIAGVCHDIDHRGYNNAFFQKLNLPLANLYSTSVMEQHHYRQTVTILHTESSNIFSFLEPTEYKAMLELIREAIIATDLALYFGNQKQIAKAVEEGTFDLNDETMHKRAKALMMTAADLCAVCKPWSTQQKTVRSIYDEFYMQGDEEKKRGFDPIPMMDRTKRDEIPKQQVGFIDFICCPLYKTLNDILPGTKPLVEGCLENRQKWTEVVEQQNVEKTVGELEQKDS